MSPRAAPPLRCAIVGLGRIGSALEEDSLREKPATHAGAVAARADCVLEAGCDPVAGRRAAFSRRWGCRRVYEEAEEMLARHAVDILHVATPTDTHLEVVERCLRAAARGAGEPPAGRAVAQPGRAAGEGGRQAGEPGPIRGLRLIVCEKPLAGSAAEARQIVGLCARARVPLLVNHERRYSRDYLRARRRVLAADFGELLALEARLYMDRGAAPAEILWHDGTHMLDAIRFLSGGEPEVTGAWGDPRAPGAVFQALLRLGPAPCSLRVSGAFEPLVFELELDFRRGRLRLGNGVYEEWESAPSRHYEGFHSLRRLGARAPRRTGYFTGMMADAVAVCRRPGAVPVSSGRDGLRAAELIEAVLAAAG